MVLYGVPDTPNGHKDAAVIEIDFQSLMEGLDSSQRLGRSFAEHGKPRPLRVCFNSLTSKHEFLSRAKELREKLGVRCDDDLTRLQQQRREELSADFLTLKSKGYSPFFRGSHLHYRSKDKLFTCNKGQGCSAPAI